MADKLRGKEPSLNLSRASDILSSVFACIAQLRDIYPDLGVVCLLVAYTAYYCTESERRLIGDVFS